MKEVSEIHAVHIATAVIHAFRKADEALALVDDPQEEVTRPHPVLAQGHGSFFAAAPLWSRAGTLGSVFGYQGQPSWLFATLNQPTAQPEHYDVQLITRDGRHLPAGTAVLGGARETWAALISVNLTNVAQVRFVAADGQTTMVAYLNARSPWGPG